jgi:hypothetical protein
VYNNYAAGQKLTEDISINLYHALSKMPTLRQIYNDKTPIEEKNLEELCKMVIAHKGLVKLSLSNL